MSKQRMEDCALYHVQGMGCTLTESEGCRMPQMAIEQADCRE